MRNPVHATILVLATALLCACNRAADMTDLRRDLEARAPGVHFELEGKVGWGSFGQAATVTFLALLPPAWPALPTLWDVDEVQTARYRLLAGTQSGPADLRDVVPEALAARGLLRLAQVDDEDRRTWVYYRPDCERIPELYIAALAPGELVLARLEGDFEDTFARAMRWNLVAADFDALR